MGKVKEMAPRCKLDLRDVCAGEGREYAREEGEERKRGGKRRGRGEEEEGDDEGEEAGGH